MKKLETVVLKGEDRSHGNTPLILRRVVREDEHGKYALVHGMKAYLEPREGNGFYIIHFREKK